MLRRARSSPLRRFEPRPGREHAAQRAVALATRLGVAQQQLEEPDEIVAVPLARRVRLAEAELAAASRAGGTAGRRGCATARPARSRSGAASRPAASPRARRPRGARARARRTATATRSTSGTRAGGAERTVRTVTLMRAPSPCRARTRACDGTGRASARDAAPGGGSAPSPAAASAGTARACARRWRS